MKCVSEFADNLTRGTGVSTPPKGNTSWSLIPVPLGHCMQRQNAVNGTKSGMDCTCMAAKRKEEKATQSPWNKVGRNVNKVIIAPDVIAR